MLDPSSVNAKQIAFAIKISLSAIKVRAKLENKSLLDAYAELDLYNSKLRQLFTIAP